MKKFFTHYFWIFIVGTILISCNKNERTDTENAVTYADPGFYFGLVAYNDNLTVIDPSLFSSSSLGAFYNVIDGLENSSGALLYHAVNTALDNLENTSLPEYIDNVTLVTFTAGTDKSSYVLNDKYASGAAYLSGLNSRIKTEKVNGTPITAYAVGYLNDDVEDVSLFNETLEQLSSGSDKKIVLSNINQLDATLQQLSYNIYQQISSQNITLKVEAPEPDTKIRFTFDEVGNANQSDLYIDGNFEVSGDDYVLNNLVLNNISCDNGQSVTGSISGTTVSFTFNHIQIINQDTPVSADNLKQWNYGLSDWVMAETFNTYTDFISVSEQKSAAVVFIVDCSSIVADNFTNVKSGYKKFVAGLQAQEYSAAAQIRFEKTGTFNYVTQMAVSRFENNTWIEELASYNFGNQNGMSPYYNIPVGNLVLEYYDTYPNLPEPDWYFCFDQDPYFNFENDKKYTLVCTENDSLTFDLFYDGAIGVSTYKSNRIFVSTGTLLRNTKKEKSR